MIVSKKIKNERKKVATHMFFIAIVFPKWDFNDPFDSFFADGNTNVESIVANILAPLQL